VKTQRHIASRVSRQHRERCSQRLVPITSFAQALEMFCETWPQMLKQYQQSVVAFGEALATFLAQRVNHGSTNQ
jgi:hypothetical protein